LLLQAWTESNAPNVLSSLSKPDEWKPKRPECNVPGQRNEQEDEMFVYMAFRSMFESFAYTAFRSIFVSDGSNGLVFDREQCAVSCDATVALLWAGMSTSDGVLKRLGIMDDLTPMLQRACERHLRELFLQSQARGQPLYMFETTIGQGPEWMADAILEAGFGFCQTVSIRTARTCDFDTVTWMIKSGFVPPWSLDEEGKDRPVKGALDGRILDPTLALEQVGYTKETDHKAIERYCDALMAFARSHGKPDYRFPIAMFLTQAVSDGYGNVRVPRGFDRDSFYRNSCDRDLDNELESRTRYNGTSVLEWFLERGQHRYPLDVITCERARQWLMEAAATYERNHCALGKPLAELVTRSLRLDRATVVATNETKDMAPSTSTSSFALPSKL
jgi:hypothetical protein